MKRLLVILMAVGLFGAMPVLAAEHSGMMMDTKSGVRECALQAETIQQKIKRIEGEIKNGSKKYSAEDLKKLQGKLQETKKFLEQMSND